VRNVFPYKPRKSVLLDSNPSVLLCKVVPASRGCRRLTGKAVIELAIHKYRSCGKGITFDDVQTRFLLRKTQAQRSLKHFHMGRVLFTAGDLNSQGIDLLNSTNPQQYFPTCIKADILENLKKRSSVRVGTTVSNPSNLSNHGNALYNAHKYDRAQSFLDVLIQLPYSQLHIHKLQLMLSIDKEYYQSLTNKAASANKGKCLEENIGCRHVTYTFYPNGRVIIAVRSSDTPFKLETDDDLVILFSFFGQVRDRLIYYVSDIRERGIPLITEWILKECDLNKDVNIDEKAQLHLPDIQLKHADHVFRMYIKSLHDKAVCRGEVSLTLDTPLIRVLESIVLPMRVINQINERVMGLEGKIDSASIK
jgi:hypothetical protein